MNKGKCLCGGIAYTVDTFSRDVVNCHCHQCRQFHGHYAAYAAASRDNVTITDEHGLLNWYCSSVNIRRGFCRECGSSLFWDKLDSDLLRIAAGSLLEPTRLHTRGHIYVNFAGDYYRILDNLPKKREGLNSPEIGE